MRPRSRRYTSVFFKKSWDIIGNDVCNAVRDFFSNGKLLQEVNYTILALIPKGKRGLRQGDLMSPYLFTLVMEILTLIFKQKVVGNEEFQYHKYCHKQKIVNVCFADDLILFARGDFNSAKFRKLKTQDKLRQWDVGKSVDLNLLMCPLCKAVPDSHEHLFFECSFSSKVWKLVTRKAEEKYTTSITKHYAARYYKEDIEDMIPERWSKEVRRYHFEALNDIHHLEEDKIDFFKVGMSIITRGIDQRIPFTVTATHKRVVYLNQYNIKSLIKRSAVKKFSDGTLVKIHENLIDMLSKNKLGSGNKRLKERDWTDYDVKSSIEMLKKIDETLRNREQLRRLKKYVGGHPKTVNPRTFVRPL
nr:putative reverse transcriptase domain, reverse transcriptase zinc-binding domain protein [Tanacetum cinerariifolium]GEW21164.1 putative reverse transcriptase domain, reverse transcriptase zinc-binding domain protein [Tanacetum cinerariifolium]